MPWPENLSPVERLELAKQRTQAVVRNYIDLVSIHANTQMVFYTDVLSSQIPRSRAANAFNCFRESLFRVEIVRLCTIWDSARPDRESIPSIVALVDDPDVSALVQQQARGMYIDKFRRFGEELADRAIASLNVAIADAGAVAGGDRMRRLRDHRDGFLAHALADAVTAQRAPAQYGDERHIFEATEPIVDKLHISINGTGFAWDMLHEQIGRQTDELWSNCRFVNIPTRL